MSSTEDGPGNKASISSLNDHDLIKQYDQNQNKNRELSGKESKHDPGEIVKPSDGSSKLQEGCQSHASMDLVNTDGIVKFGETQDEDKTENVSSIIFIYLISTLFHLI